MLLARGTLAREFETAQTSSQRTSPTLHPLARPSSPHRLDNDSSSSSESVSDTPITRDEKPISFVRASSNKGKSVSKSKGKRRRSESADSRGEIPTTREATTGLVAARVELDSRGAKDKQNIAQELSIWEKIVFTFDRDRDVEKRQSVEMDRDGDSVGVGGSGKGLGKVSGGERDEKGAERERGLGIGSRRGATPSSSTDPAGTVSSPVPTRSGSVSGAASTNPNISASGRVPPLVGPGGNLRINTRDASSVDMARTHSQHHPLSASPLQQTHHPLSSHQQHPSLQGHSQPPHPLLTPVNSTPIQGPFGALDPFTVAQLAAISVMYPQSGVPDPYELINRAQRVQTTGYSPSIGSSASAYAQQQQQYAQQMSAGINPAHQPSHTSLSHTHHQTQIHPQQRQHHGHSQHSHSMSPASPSSQWQTSMQHLGQIALQPSHSPPSTHAHLQGQQQQQQLFYGHNYPDLLSQHTASGSSPHGGLSHGHNERAVAGTSHSHSQGYASSSSSPPMSPAQQHELTQAELDAISEDKRRRNTLASGKHHV